ncbi:hypothetical protein CRH09_31260 [Nocardia terpenica]|uniref:Uncharacterized protein n=1 Tax=Nocardia terpenica TaxID=455432 RepID=A0A291RRW7_9NOCA|nr:hypothetical protein CRH09_31260 [Nocardia terpenica]
MSARFLLVSGVVGTRWELSVRSRSSWVVGAGRVWISVVALGFLPHGYVGWGGSLVLDDFVEGGVPIPTMLAVQAFKAR